MLQVNPRSKLLIPDPSLVLLAGAAGSGKSSFAKKHFLPTEILSSDFCRALVSDDESDQTATADAFEILRFIAGKRLAAGRLTVVDATNVQRDKRELSVLIARQFQIPAVAVILDVPELVCLEQNQKRQRQVPPAVIHEQLQQLRKCLPGFPGEGFLFVYVLRSVDEIENAALERLAGKPAPAATPPDSWELPL